MNNDIAIVAMSEFLKQFKAKDYWTRWEHELVIDDCFNLAVKLELVEYLKFPKGSTYYTTLRCTVQGRSFLRKNATAAAL